MGEGGDKKEKNLQILDLQRLASLLGGERLLKLKNVCLKISI